MSAHPVGAAGVIGAAETPDVGASTEGYAARFAGPAGEYLLGVQRRILLDLVRPWPGARVLDIGGGHAQAAAPLLEAGCSVTVLGSCAEALERVQRVAPGVATAVGDLSDPPFDPKSFDIVVSLRTLTHLDGWRRAVGGMCRVAKSAVIVDFAPALSFNALSPVLFGLKRKLEGNTRTFLVMRRGDVRRVMREAGFGGIVERPQFFWPIVMHRVMRRPGVSRGLEGVAGALGLTGAVGSPVILRAVRGGGV